MSTYPKNTKNGMVYDYYVATWYIEIMYKERAVHSTLFYNYNTNRKNRSQTELYL